jgi:hypothetical protein
MCVPVACPGLLAPLKALQAVSLEDRPVALRRPSPAPAWLPSWRPTQDERRAGSPGAAILDGPGDCRFFDWALPSWDSPVKSNGRLANFHRPSSPTPPLSPISMATAYDRATKSFMAAPRSSACNRSRGSRLVSNLDTQGYQRRAPEAGDGVRTQGQGRARNKCKLKCNRIPPL